MSAVAGRAPAWTVVVRCETVSTPAVEPPAQATLDPRIVGDLRKRYDALVLAGKRVLPSERLTKIYDRFRVRFGPAVLEGLDGEALLATLHGRPSRDSLVYWLEFKDDEEMPAIFGSIAGGSALKFGIYRSNETGEWMKGSPQQQVRLTVEQAVAEARRQRDQFLAGARVLEQARARYGERLEDIDYDALQDAMERAAPDLAETAWGHKYFSLLYPELLDPYHNHDYQRFHLIKLLLRPPERSGRYVAAGCFVPVIRALGLPWSSLLAVLNDRHGPPHAYWRVGTSADGSSSTSIWPGMRDGGYVCIGWKALGDLSELAHTRDSKDELRAKMQEIYPAHATVVGKNTRQVFDFATRVRPGDIVLAAQGATILGVGRITGDYFFAPGIGFPHRRPVEWLSKTAWRQPVHEGLRTTFHALRKHPENLIMAERRVMDEQGAAPPDGERRVVPAPRPLAGIPLRIHNALERKRQVIVYGPPGTGKTYWAERSARELAARSWFGRGWDQLDETQKAQIQGTGGTPAAVELCCFHPAYGYEDFLEGLRPEVANGQLVFQRRDGIFKRLCQRAAQPGNGNRHFYLVIDEINRGDIPRIFGELLTVLERSKRGQRITLPQSGEPFAVPDNVYVIGTMNTADRSIALVDTALRRRFGFIELMPDPTVLDTSTVAGIPLGPWLAALNQRICAHVSRDARNLQIGHSYLMDGTRPIADVDRLAEIVQDDIIPLIEEYCYEDFGTLAQILGTTLVDSKAQAIDHSLFAPGRRDDLVQALLKPFPELAASERIMMNAEIASREAEDAPEEDTDDIDAAEAGASSGPSGGGG